jgi:hypothetical protein
MSRLAAEPEVVKFVRVDAVQYEHEWDPNTYVAPCAHPPA